MDSVADNTYALDAFGFGLVYKVSNGTKLESYFSNYTLSGAKAIFSTNFKGIGLPIQMWNSFKDDFTNMTSNESSSSDGPQDNYFILPGACSSYSYFSEYTFQVVFSSNDTEYIRVPLSAFAEDDHGKCNVFVQMLSPS